MRLLPKLVWAPLLLTCACLETAVPAAEGCNDCHGEGDRIAPPRALGGFTAASHVGVGAHVSHLEGSLLGRPVACVECHVVPAATDAAGHVDTTWPAEVKWGPTAKTGDAKGVWSHEAETCSGTYCHGGTMAGGTVRAVVWTTVDGSQSACDACHGMPPPAPHPSNSSCVDCHAPTAGGGGTIADPTTHIDGNLDFTGGDPCVGCHGDADSLAPPPDSNGATDTSARNVGAHRAHVLGAALSTPVACGDCHVVPARTRDVGHIDDAPAEVTFAGVAISGGATPTYDQGTGTCANTYCHGTGAPPWTLVDGTHRACDACHGMPPPAPHPGSARCGDCHGSTSSDTAIIRPMRHIDGTVDF